MKVPSSVRYIYIKGDHDIFEYDLRVEKKKHSYKISKCYVVLDVKCRERL